jgi:hypothetical protein
MSNRLVSNCPLCFASHSQLSHQLVSAFASAIEGLEAAPFSFGDGREEESRRNIFSLRDIFKHDPNLRDLLGQWVRSELPHSVELFAAEAGSDLKLFEPEKYRMTLRVRVLEDQPGYSLAPHKDSKDTLFAFIGNLNPHNLNTSIFIIKNAIRVGCEKESPLFLNRISDLSSKLFPEKTNFLVTKNDFTGDPVIWFENGVVFAYSMYETAPIFVVMNEEKITTTFGEILAIHNPRFPILATSTVIDNSVKFARHGVWPGVVRKRPLLLMDLLGNHSEHDVLFVDRNERDDDRTHYFYIRPETVRSMLSGAGLI